MTREGDVERMFAMVIEGSQRVYFTTPAGDEITERFAQINEKYSLEMNFESVPELCRRFGLTFPEL